ncbi:hypothetical protein AVEN_87707-1, partial [Araneus ventricosus]
CCVEVWRRVGYTVNQLTPALLKHPGSTEERLPRQLGVLTAITGHGPTPPEGGTFRHRWRVTQPLPLLYPQEKREPAYLSDDFSSTYSWCLPPRVREE